jgi:uncharacterized protein (DUF1697 family)
MALVVFLRGVNVGGHRAFRPSLLVGELRTYGFVNFGAAGTFVVRNPGASRAKFRAALLRKLPFEAEIVICESRDLLRLVGAEPFGAGSFPPDSVRFVTVLSKAARLRPALPIFFPEGGDWLVQVMELRDRFALGTYRRHMKTIGYLGRVDKLFGVPVTTRNWNTILAVARLLKAT